MTSNAAPLARYEAELRARLDDPDALGALLRELVDGGGVRAALDDILRSGAEERFTRIGEVGKDTVIFLRGPDLVLHLVMVRGPSPLLHTVGADAVAVARGPAPIRVDRYRIAEPYDPTIFVAGAPLAPLPPLPYDGGVIHERVAEPIVYDYRSDAPFAIVRVSRRPSADQIWFFDRAQRAAVFTALGYSELSGYVQLAKTMAALGERRALPVLEQLARHSSHVVRWAAIQAIGKLDGARGIAHLRAAVQDRHPHIQRGAAKALERLGG